MRTTFFLSLAFIFVHFSCSKPKIPVEFQVPLEFTEGAFYLSEFADSISYIPLQSPEGYLMSDNLHFFFTPQYILAEDRMTKHVFLYNKNGAFITKIGALGRGAEEYVNLYGIAMDEVAGKIFIGDNPRRSILVFDLQGNFLNRIQLDYYLGAFTVTKDGHLFIFTDRVFIPQPDMPNLHVLDYEGNTLHASKKDLPYPDNTNSVGHLYTYEDRIHILPQANYMDTAFYFDATYTFKPYFELTYPGRVDKTSADFVDTAIYNPVEKGIGVYRPIIETKNLIFAFQSTLDRMRVDLIYNKRTDSTYNLFKGYGQGRFFTGLMNDLDGGVAFIPAGQINEQWVYSTLNYKQILNIDQKLNPADTVIRSLEAHTRMKELLSRVKEDDPVVIQMVRFK